MFPTTTVMTSPPMLHVLFPSLLAYSLDGHTYERRYISTWLARENKSPMNPSCRISESRLRPNLALRQVIEQIVTSGQIGPEGAAEWEARKQEAQTLGHIQKHVPRASSPEPEPDLVEAGSSPRLQRRRSNRLKETVQRLPEMLF